MFSFVRGKILHIDGIFMTILVENTGLGLEVLASPSLLWNSSENGEISAYIHHHITEVSQTLFGFSDINEKNLFKNLIKVPWIGGKTALNMLGLGGENLLNAIQSENDKLLATIPWIGKKTAQKIIVDLKGSINFEKIASDETKKITSTADTSLISSLVAMWYEKSRVEAIISTLDNSISLSEKVKIAIKNLS